MLVHVLGADDALDGARGARRQAARCNPVWWINPMPNTRIIIAIQSVPFRLVSACTILHCPATLLNPPWPAPPAVSIIILHSFCAPPPPPIQYSQARHRPDMCPAPSKQQRLGRPLVVHLYSWQHSGVSRRPPATTMRCTHGPLAESRTTRRCLARECVLTYMRQR